MLNGLLGGMQNNANPNNGGGWQNQFQGVSNKVIGLFDNQALMSTINAKIAEDILKARKEIASQKYRFPAVIEGAKVHETASKFGYNPASQKPMLCPCCSFNVNTQSVRFCYPTTNVNKGKDANGVQNENFQLTSGVALFFSFIKMACLYLLMRVVIMDAFNLFTSLPGKQCEQASNCDTFFAKASSFNKHDSNQQSYIVAQDALNLVLIVVSIVFFVCYRRMQYKLYDSIDEDIQTEDDFTLFIQNLDILDFPSQGRQKESVQFAYRKHLEDTFIKKLQRFRDNWQDYEDYQQGSIEKDFSKTLKGKPPSKEIIKSISLCFNLMDIEKIANFRKQLMAEHEKAQQKSKSFVQGEQLMQYQEDIYKPIPKRIEFLNESEIILSKKFAQDNSPIFNMTHFIGCAFVSFQYQHYRQYIKRQYVHDGTWGSSKKLKITRATVPEDIFWRNLRVTYEDRRSRIINSYLIMFMTLTFAFGAVLGLDFVKSTGTQKASTVTTSEVVPLPISQTIRNLVITILVPIVILVINQILFMVITTLTTYEAHQTRTFYLFSLIVKLVISQFVNNAMLYFIINRINFDHFLSSTGLVIEVSSLIAISGFIQIFTNLLFPSALIRRVKLWWKYRKLKNEDTVNLFQVNLNKQFQLIEFDIAARYSYYLLQLYTAFFYSYLIPIVVPALLVIFAIQYWVDKYNLFYRSSLKYEMNFNLSRNILKMFEISLFIHAAGCFVFSIYLQRDHEGDFKISYINLVGLIIATLYGTFIIFVSEYRERKILGSYQTYEELSYSECVNSSKFYSRFWTSNPVTNLVQEYEVTGYKNQIAIKNEIFKINDEHCKKSHSIQDILSRRQIYQ